MLQFSSHTKKPLQAMMNYSGTTNMSIVDLFKNCTFSLKSFYLNKFSKKTRKISEDYNAMHAIMDHTHGGQNVDIAMCRVIKFKVFSYLWPTLYNDANNYFPLMALYIIFEQSAKRFITKKKIKTCHYFRTYGLKKIFKLKNICAEKFTIFFVLLKSVNRSL